MTSTMRRSLAAAAALTLLGLGTAGCSSTGSDSDGGASSAGSAVPESTAESEAAASDAAGADTLATSVVSEDAGVPAETARQALIAQGNVSLRSDDVGRARFDVGKVVDTYDGSVAQDDTETDADGDPERARLVLRIPSADFDAAMTDLERVAEVIQTNRQVEDVTTEVIDTDVRVRLQQRSIDRIELLLDRAESIRDIVAIEGQLSRREADLASLSQQQAYLADQTQLATITVSLERPADEPDAKDDQDDEATGFLAGLDQGWSGLTKVTVGLLTLGGTALPFAVVALLLGVPLTAVARSLRRRTTPAVAADA